MEEAGGTLVDTNILVSKKLKALLTLGGQLYVTPVVLLEYITWALESRNRRLAEGDYERARGYERLIKLLPSLLQELSIEVIEQGLEVEDLKEAVNLILHRSVDPGDALNAITARKKGLKVITQDRDWQRLKDCAKEVILL